MKEKHCLFYPNPADLPLLPDAYLWKGKKEKKKVFNFNKLDAMLTPRGLGMVLIYLVSFWLVSK